jgi:hypothetical protein
MYIFLFLPNTFCSYLLIIDSKLEKFSLSLSLLGRQTDRQIDR